MPPGSEAGEWHQLHPLTPVLRSWRLAAPLAFGLLQTANGLSDRRWLLPLLAAVLLLGAAGGYASWRTTRYRIGADSIEIHSGVLHRQLRRLPLARIESVDIRRSLLARALGLAELRVEAVSTGDSELALSYLAEGRATDLRATLLARRAGVAADSPPPPEHVLAAVPLHALVVTGLMMPGLTLAALLALSAGVATYSVTAAGAGVAALLPVLLIVTVTSLARQEASYGFTVADAPDGLRIRRGLLNLRTQTIPAGRVQAVRIEEPLLWRRWGWVRLYVDVAGYAGGQRADRQQTSLLMPVAPRSLVGPLLGRVLPGVDLAEVPLTPPPRAARWRAPISHRWLAAGWTEEHAVTRRGVVRRITDVVPHGKVQSLRITQGPLQRRLRLASLHLDTPGATVSAVALHRGVAEAHSLAERSRALDPTAAGGVSGG